MDPVSQVLAQQTSGSAQGQGFGQFFVQGKQLAQQQQQLNLSRRNLTLQEKQEERLQTRQSQLLPQEIAINAAQISQLGMDFVAKKNKAEFDAKQNAYGLQVQEANIAVGDAINLISQKGLWGKPEAWDIYNPIIAKYPLATVSQNGQLFYQNQTAFLANEKMQKKMGGAPTVAEITTPEGKFQYGSAQAGALPIQINRQLNTLYDQRGKTTDPAILRQIDRQILNLESQTLPDKGQVARDIAEQRRIIANPSSTPEDVAQAERVIAGYDEQEGGKMPAEMQVVRDKAAQTAILADPNATPEAKEKARSILAGYQKPLSGIGREEEDLANLEAAGDPARVKRFTDLQRIRDAAKGESVTVSPDGTISITKGGAAGGQTTANRTELNRKIGAADEALYELDKVEEAIRKVPGAFGPQGIVGEFFENVQGVFDPNSPAYLGITRNQAGLMFTRVADGLRIDTGNMSLYERRQLDKLGDVRSWTDKPELALGKVGNMRNMLVAGQLRRLKTVEKQIPDSLIRQIDPREVRRMYMFGVIDDEGLIRATNAGKISKEEATKLYDESKK